MTASGRLFHSRNNHDDTQGGDVRASTLILMGRPSFTLAAVSAALFGSGNGAIYEPGDLASIYQESTGVTAGAVGQAGGLVLDERYALGRGAELRATGAAALVGAVTAASYNTSTGDGTAVRTDASNQSYIIFSGLTQNALYRITLTNTHASNSIALRLGSAGAAAYGTTISPSEVRTMHINTGANTAFLVCSAGGAVSFTVSTVSEVLGNHSSQSVSASRPILTSYSGYIGALFDGTDDSVASATGGGGSAGFFWCGAVRVIGGDGSARSVWSDVGTNTGYRVRIASTNKLALGAGNGTAYTSATTADDVLAGNTYVLTCWDDGVNLNAQVNRGTVATAARPAVSAGGAGFSLGKDHNASSAFANIAIFAQVYRKDGGVSARDRLRAQRYCAARAGIAI